MADSDLDELYWVKPDEFIALRTRLVSAAKRRGDRDGARRISITSKPTAAAWVVNRLVIGHRETRQRLADLGDRLRAAHAAMDGELIRGLSVEQRRLIEELTRTALGAAELARPSAAIRDDVGATLQAAVADPDVRAALGRLTRPQRWSGFGFGGDGGTVAATGVAPRTTRARRSDTAQAGKDAGNDTRAAEARAAAREREDRLRVAREREEQWTAAVAAAEQARSSADGTLSERRAGLAAARAQRDDARRTLRAAERDLAAAERDHDKAQQASRAATAVVREAQAQLKRAR